MDENNGNYSVFRRNIKQTRAIARCTFAIVSVCLCQRPSLTVQLWKANWNQFSYIGSHAEYKREYGVNITFRRMHVRWPGRRRRATGDLPAEKQYLPPPSLSLCESVIHFYSALLNFSLSAVNSSVYTVCGGAHMRNQFLLFAPKHLIGFGWTILHSALKLVSRKKIRNKNETSSSEKPFTFDTQLHTANECAT